MIEIIVGLTIGIMAVFYVMAKVGLLGLLFNLEAFILVLGGTIGSTVITHPFRILSNAIKAIIVTLFGIKRYRPENVIRTIVNLSERVQIEGVIGIQNQLNTVDKFLRDGLQMIIDGIDPEIIRENLGKEIVFTRKRHEQIINVFRNMGTYSPIFGLLGTLLGVVQVLKNITDVKNLGASMALAVTTTLYGIFFANFIFLPLAGKLESHSEEELLIKEVMIEGILSIQKQDIPLIVSKKLEAFFSQKYRKKK